MTSYQALYTKMRKSDSLCYESKVWMKGRTKLAAAWKASPNGSWLAWWLFTVLPYGRHVKSCEIRQVANSIGLYYGPVFSGDGISGVEQQAFANAIRAHYSYTGRKLTPKS